MPKRRVEIDEEEMNDNHGIVQGAKPTANGFTWEFDGVDDYIDFG